jgi:hypothetical protein
MAYNLRRGRGVKDEEHPPPPPPPTLAELMQTVVEGQRLLVDADEDMGSMHMTMLGESHEGQRD